MQVPPDEFTRAAREAARAHDAVVAAGGDGTVSAWPPALVGSDTPLGVLPLGTLNHFAKDLGVPLELEGAAAVVAGRARPADRRRRGQRPHLRQQLVRSALYPLAVAVRERLQEQPGRQVAGDGCAPRSRCFARLPVLNVGCASTTPGRSCARRSSSSATTSTTCRPPARAGASASTRLPLRLHRRAPRPVGTCCWLAARALFGRLQRVERLRAQHVARSSTIQGRRAARCRWPLDGEVLGARHAAALPHPARRAAGARAADARRAGVS